MAKVRIGFSTAFELENELVGIGTDNPTNTLQALGNIKSTNAKAVGVSTFTTFDGFTDTKLSLEGSAGAKQGTTSGEIIIEGEVTVSSGTTFTSGPKNLTVTNKFTLPKKTTYAPTIGSTRFNENLAALEFYTGVEWRAVNSYVDSGNRCRGVHMGGNPGSTPYDGAIDFTNLSSKGNSVSFGQLRSNRRTAGACSSSIRGLIGGGRIHPANTDLIDYITIASQGDSIEFGDLTSAREHVTGGGSSTRGVFAGGHPNTNIIEYVEIMTLGNAIDFGDCLTAQHAKSMVASPTRAVIGEASSCQASSITISSTGNAIYFGDLTYDSHYANASSNSVRGIWSQGYNAVAYRKDICYITIASDGNGIEFGEASVGAYNQQGCASGTRALTQIAGVTGSDGSATYVNTIEYVEITTTGNAMDFGDLSIKKHLIASISDCHGGLGGF